MKKNYCCILVLLLILCGCQSENTLTQRQLDTYQEYRAKVLNNNGILSRYIPFNYELEVLKEDKEIYLYTLTINKPQVAMHNIKAIMLNPKSDTTEIAVTLGLNEASQYTLIPNQVNVSKNYPGGFVLSGQTPQSDFDVFVLIEWEQDSTGEIFDAYLSFKVKDGIVEKQGETDE